MRWARCGWSSSAAARSSPARPCPPISPRPQPRRTCVPARTPGPRPNRSRSWPESDEIGARMTPTRPVPIVACLAGDGIGPEVMAEGGRVIDAAGELFGIRVRQVHLPFGGDAIDKHGDPFPPHVRAAVKASDAVLLGAVGGPRWESSRRRPEQGLLELRRELDAYANLRPVRHGQIDLMVVRELTGGLYFGHKELGADNAVDVCSYTREQVERVARWAFRLA